VLVPFLASILIGYGLGSVSSASVIAWIIAKVDMSKEQDGRISASEVYHKLGMAPFFLVVLFDAIFALGAVIIGGSLSEWNLNVMMIAGIAALCGHNWSIFLKFRGGLGATAILGVLIVLVTWQLFVGLAIGALVMLITRKPGLSTAFVLCGISASLIIQKGFGFLSIYPMLLFLIMLLKRYQVQKLVNPAH
jgi:acyl phosphate:glycerol-3-phosphate acyltransferase